MILKQETVERVVTKEVTELRNVVVSEQVVKPDQESIEEIAMALIKNRYKMIQFTINEGSEDPFFCGYRERSMEVELELFGEKNIRVTIEEIGC